MKALVNVFLFLAVVLNFSGCILVPFIDAFKQSGATESDRMTLLSAEVKKFNEALGWGNKTEAMTFVADEARTEMSKKLKAFEEEERLVEAKVDEVAWSNSAFNATVSMKVRYFKVPFYVVKTRTEEQEWEFFIPSGWKLKGLKQIEG